MGKLTHGFKLDLEKCEGKLACMRACPTQAIRVKEGKARLLSELCIDCGSCLKACPSRAISATTRSLKEVWKFKYKVAIPTPILFGQFPTKISPAHIIEGLKSLGFDAVWVFEVETALINRAIREYVAKWKGRYPLISSSCPVIVRLIQVAYPGMVQQLIHIEPPRELAGREAKRFYSKKLGISPEEVAAIYVTSCQARTISILEPAEGAKSNLDGSIGISDVYNGILAAARSLKEGEPRIGEDGFLHSSQMLQWAMSEGQRRNLSGSRYMSLTGLLNIIHVFDHIEKGKLRDLDFLECYACWGGCVNGNLTVDNLYVTRSKLLRLMGELPDSDPWINAEIEKRQPLQDFCARAPIKPRPTKKDMPYLKDRIVRMKEAESILLSLPELDCGLCGAPSCKILARDIALGFARKTDCVFFSKDRIENLKKIYLQKGIDESLGTE